MREIVHIQVGQCGNQIGSGFWENVSQEFELDNHGEYQGSSGAIPEGVGLDFSMTSAGKYIPRAVLIDLDASALTSIRANHVGSLFRPGNFVAGEYSAGKSWARGYYEEGSALAEIAVDAIRREAESCDCIQGFQLLHSLGGGTGSGLGTLLLTKLREEFPDRILTTFSVLPSEKRSECPVEPYNAVLSLHQLIEYADATFCIDNEALYDICERDIKSTGASYQHLNAFISRAISGATASLRIPGQINSDFRKMLTSMVPAPRLHFLALTSAPRVYSSEMHTSGSVAMAEIVRQTFSTENMMLSSDSVNRHPIAGFAVFRGDFSTNELQAEMLHMQTRQADDAALRVPDNIHNSLCVVPKPGSNMEATLVQNSTAVQDVFNRMDGQFQELFRRKLYMRPFTCSMDEMEFAEAQSNLQDLVQEYQPFDDIERDGTLSASR